jgi:indolepyruvate ferredoxin oxidoreductase
MLVDVINSCTNRGRNLFVDATRLAEGLFSSHLAVNIFLLGVAYQGGLIPISAEAVVEAIRLNGVEVERNLQAFGWGRKYYEDAPWVEALLEWPHPQEAQPGVVERRAAELERYQNRRYAEAYLEFLREVESRRPEVKETVARYLYKLMAYKDEYEVARLLTKRDLEQQIRGMWEEVVSIRYNLHPPVLRALGWKKKIQVGGWFRTPLRILARLKFLRGTVFDVFGYAAIRREERALIGWYRDLVRASMDSPVASEMASLPDQIRGYENVKMENIRKVKAAASEKLAQAERSKMLSYWP